MGRRVLDGASLAVGVVVLVCSLYVGLVGRADPGWVVTWQDDLATIVAVSAAGRADRLGIRQGDVVVTLDDGRSGARFPSPADTASLDRGDFLQASVMTAENAVATRATGVVHDYVGTVSLDIGSRARSALVIALLTAAAGLTLLWQIVRRLPGSHPIRLLALPLATAALCPLLLVLGWQLGSPILMALTFWLGALAAIPLSLGLVAGLDRPLLRIAALAAVAAGATIACMGGIAAILGQGGPVPPTAAGVAVGSMTVVPALMAGLERRSKPGQAVTDVGALEFVVIGLTPLVAWLSHSTSPDISVNVWPLVAWVSVVVVGSHLTIRPLVGAAVRSAAQRDLIVAAMEAERSRLAADIHDDALQDLSMILQRLDASGDAPTAAAVRGVADRLRAICYDLRLPILDDLGVGPALEWLVARVESLVETDIRLERHDQRRPPPDVELAVYRVAQEALANAVKHGSPPIVLRYESGVSGVRLSVEDSGPGISSAALGALPSAAHFGLVAMQQRAEQIGARLQISDWPGRGTEITLSWNP